MMGIKQVVLGALSRLPDEASHDEIVRALRRGTVRTLSEEGVALARVELGPRRVEAMLVNEPFDITLEEVLKDLMRPSRVA